VGSIIKETYFIHFQDQDYDTCVVVLMVLMDWLSIPGWGNFFFNHIQTGTGPNPASCRVVTEGSFFRIEWSEYVAVRSPSMLGLLSTGTTVPFTCTVLGQNVKILQYNVL